MTTEENLLDEKENQVNPQKKTQKSDPKDDKILELEKALAEQTDIAKRAQYDLVTQRFDFERHQAMLKEQEKSMDVDILISTVKKLLPFVENLRKSLDVLSDEQKEESLAKGLQMTYDNFLKVLE
jgi:molecular chaperone GrpE (heat shock protein)